MIRPLFLAPVRFRSCGLMPHPLVVHGVRVFRWGGGRRCVFYIYMRAIVNYASCCRFDTPPVDAVVTLSWFFLLTPSRVHTLVVAGEK